MCSSMTPTGRTRKWLSNVYIIVEFYHSRMVHLIKIFQSTYPVWRCSGCIDHLFIWFFIFQKEPGCLRTWKAGRHIGSIQRGDRACCTCGKQTSREYRKKLVRNGTSDDFEKDETKRKRSSIVNTVSSSKELWPNSSLSSILRSQIVCYLSVEIWISGC